ncbi:V-type ATP synthase subunit I domain-containing protein [Mycoplasma parvum]|uniref:Uncharacterized protein n=1 Tax=Mycoplasma parvum str. Indiana TaxID=1403316 RepID=U5NC54_9MOLU|nr:hypothetical protein [Mycoplasma parvum]AGX89156.1 hypothetical protein PRV_02090 [Mycoplasma parvum str. Indiana]
MFLPSKAIALFTTSLGTIGLSSYLIPYTLKDLVPDLGNIFLTSKSSYEKQNVDKFTNEQKEILESLTNLFKDLSNGINASEERREEKLKKIQETLYLVSEIESKNLKLYEESQKIVDLLSQLSNQLSEQEAIKFKNQSDLAQIKYFEELSESLKKFAEEGKNNFNQFLEIIKKGTEKEKLTKQNVDGGGQRVKAQETLKNVQNNFSSFIQELEIEIFQLSLLKKELSYQKSKLQEYIKHLETNVSFIKVSSSVFSSRLEALRKEINTFIKRLNEFNQRLRDLQKEWEEFKDKLFIFRNYFGIVQNNLCVNAQYQNDQGKCEQIKNS